MDAISEINMPANLDILALRSLVAIADCGGYHRAADSLGVSQSSVSQHVRKIETTLGHALLERDGRGMRFTPDGESFVARARPMLQTHDDLVGRFGAGATSTVVVGATEHAAENLLPSITRAFAREMPKSHVRFRLDRSSRLDIGLDHSSIDVAVMLGSTNPAAVTATSVPLAWFCAQDWQAPPPAQPLPLVVIDGPCVIKRKAIATLDGTGRAHRVVAESGYLAGVLNAVQAGVGVALLVDSGQVPAGLRRLTELPDVPPEALQVRAGAAAPARFAGIVANAVRNAVIQSR
jgi:DNA-binding transcriptional LysR family regulator